MVPRPPNAVRPCCWQAGWLASNDEERPERGDRETGGVGKSPLDADWALHLRSFPPAYNGLNKNRAISILACSDGLYVCTPRTLCTSGSMYTLHRTNRDFFLSIGGCCTLHQNFGCYFFLSGSLGPPASASIWHLTVLHSDCFVDVSRQLSWVNWLLKREHNVRSRAVALRV